MTDLFRKVLVATDLEPGSDAAIARGQAIASTSRAALGVVVATQRATTSEHEDSRAEALAKLEEQVRSVTGLERHGFTKFVEHGDAGAIILAAAKSFDADLIVVGRKGQHDEDRVGSVALQVVRESAASVLVGREAPGPGPVVAAVDLGKGSTEVVRVAARLAEAAGAPLRVVHAIDFGRSEVLLALNAFFGGAVPPAPDQDGLVALARAALEADVAANGAKGEVEVLKGEPLRSVLEHAASLGASLLVVGATAHPLLTRLGLGSVAEAAVRGAAGSVLVVRRNNEV